jgi:hypothetical protein
MWRDPMHLWLRGWPARVMLTILAILGFLGGLATVLDFYDAYWQFTVPATLAYAVLLYIFATPKAEPGDGTGEVIFAKLFVTILIVGGTFAAVAAVIWLCTLVADNWPYIVLALLIVGGIVLWAVIAGSMDERRARRKAAEDDPLAGEAHPPPHHHETGL